jgi:hypothetical protein
MPPMPIVLRCSFPFDLICKSVVKWVDIILKCSQCISWIQFLASVLDCNYICLVHHLFLSTGFLLCAIFSFCIIFTPSPNNTVVGCVFKKRKNVFVVIWLAYELLYGIDKSVYMHCKIAIELGHMIYNQ